MLAIETDDHQFIKTFGVKWYQYLFYLIKVWSQITKFAKIRL